MYQFTTFMVNFKYEKSILKNLFEQNFYLVRTIKFVRTKNKKNLKINFDS